MTDKPISELADKIVGAIPQSDPVGRQVAVRFYRLLAEGKPVPIGRIADTLGLPGETISKVLSPCTAFYDDQGAVIGFGGLTVAEMPPHLFRVEGRTLYTGAHGTASLSRASSARPRKSHRATRSPTFRSL